jgi:hypothetical protein
MGTPRHSNKEQIIALFIVFESPSESLPSVVASTAFELFSHLTFFFCTVELESESSSESPRRDWIGSLCVLFRTGILQQRNEGVMSGRVQKAM